MLRHKPAKKLLVLFLILSMLMASLSISAYAAIVIPGELQNIAMTMNAVPWAPYSNGGNTPGAFNNGQSSSSNWNSWSNSAGYPIPVTYTWDKPVDIRFMRVRWWRDNVGAAPSGNVSWPSTASVWYLAGTEWIQITNMVDDSGAVVLNVPKAGGTGTGNSAWNPVEFKQRVATTSIRMLLDRPGTASNGVGINEWEVYGTAANDALADLCSIQLKLDNLVRNVDLPSEGDFGSTITWVSSNPAAMSNAGVITRPAIGSPAATGTLTATAVKGSYTETMTFDFSVFPLQSDADIVANDLGKLNLGDTSYVETSLNLPAYGDWLSSITWDSHGSQNLWNDGTVLKPPTGSDAVTVKLTATLTAGAVKATKDFFVTIPRTYEYQTIVSAPALNVSSKVGTVPELPRNIEATYADGTKEMRRVRWENDMAAWENDVIKKPVGANYDVKGIFVGDKSAGGNNFPVVAHVTVTATGAAAPASVPVAKPLPLNKVTLDGNSILTTNRQMSLDFLKNESASTNGTPAADSILYNFRATFGVAQPAGAVAMGGWDAPSGYLRGHGSGHFISALSLAYASTGDAALKTKLDYIIHEMRQLQLISGKDPATGQYVSQAEDFVSKAVKPQSATNSGSAVWSKDPSTWGKGFLSAYPPDQFAMLEKYFGYNTTSGIWAPYYTLHKLMSGFIDAYVYTGNEEALDIAKDLGTWVYRRLSNCTRPGSSPSGTGGTDYGYRDTMWNMYIAGEYGGMNEAMARLYEITKDANHLAAAKMFDNTIFFDNLAVNKDDIRTRHANQHVPQMVGAVKEFEVSGDAKYYDIANNFWNMIDTRYAYAVSGVGTGEMFRQPYAIAENAGSSCETCATYNMLKVTKALNGYHPDNAKYMDFYERGLMNQIAGAIDTRPNNTNPHRITYQYAIGHGAGLDERGASSWSCCNGTGLENHVKYQEAAYFTTADTIFVGLYIPSTATWDAKGVSLKQECSFPAEFSKITVNGSGTFDIKLRVPYWASAGFVVKVNGVVVAENPALSTYVLAGKTWNNGDVIEITMPFEQRLDIAPDTIGGKIAGVVMYGPIAMSKVDNNGDWLTFKVNSYLDDASLIKTNGADTLNTFSTNTDKVYSMTVNGSAFIPRYTIFGQASHTYTLLDIEGETNTALRKQLFDVLQEAHDFSKDDPAKVNQMKQQFAAAVAVYQDSYAYPEDISGQIDALKDAMNFTLFSLEDLAPGASLEATTYLKNKTAAVEGGCAILAVYDGAGRLVSATPSEGFEVAADGRLVVKTNVVLPTDVTGVTVKVFVWSNQLVPLRPVTEF